MGPDPQIKTVEEYEGALTLAAAAANRANRARIPLDHDGHPRHGLNRAQRRRALARKCAAARVHSAAGLKK